MKYGDLPISSLFLDCENPRLENLQESQTEAIRALISAPKQKQKLLRLAQDIVEHGLNLSELPIVMPSNGDHQYIVLEGNRRLAAIKLLENPGNFVELYTGKALAQLRNLSLEYQKGPIAVIRCVIIDNREEAHHWIELRHEGEQQGAGVVPWGASEAARFRQRSGQKEIHLQVLDFLQNQGSLAPEEIQGIPITSLRRVVEDSYARQKLGYEIIQGEFIPGEDTEKLAIALRQVVSDLSSGQKKVKDVYLKSDRRQYIDELVTRQQSATNEGDRFSPAKENNEENLPVKESGSESDAAPVPGVKNDGDGRGKTRAMPTAKSRHTLIPQSVTLRINQGRINEIYDELKHMPLEQYPNAVAILFRVFIELSLDEFIKKHKEDIGKDAEDRTYKLPQKLKDAALYLKNKNIMTEKEVAPVNFIAENNGSLIGGSSIVTMNQYVHNPYFKPCAGDLRVTWDNLALFIAKLWE